MPAPSAASVNGLGAQWVVLSVTPGGPVIFVDPANPSGDPLAAADDSGTPPAAACMALMQAQQLQGQMGPPWIVNHAVTLVPPAQHRQWLAGRGVKWALP